MRLNYLLTAFLLVIANSLPSVSAASECLGQVLSAAPDLTRPNSVANSDLESLINGGASWADGVKISVDGRGKELWLDVTEYPGTTAIAATPRIIWLIGRISSGAQTRVVFSDGKKGLFAIDEPILKNIGCRFVIGQEGGENPIALMREFYDALTYFDTGARVAPRFNGSLLGDTMIALDVNNKVFVPAWVANAVK